MRVHQHGADRPVSRRRTAGGELRARAPRSTRPARVTGHRSGAAAPAQPDSAEGDPFKTAVGTTYDSGDFAPILDKALALAHYASSRSAGRDSFKRKRLRGIGISCFLEHAGRAADRERALIFEGDQAQCSASACRTPAKGHATVYPRLVGAKLGIPASRIRHRHGDTNLDLKGNPSVGSRSTMTVGSALYRAADLMLEKAKPIASGLLETAESDVAYENGNFLVVGTDRRVSLFEVAARAKESGDPLDTKATVDTPQTFPNGCHIAEVEIDPDTGAIEIVAYAAVDDAGVVLDHTLAAGQLVGGLAQGIGAGLMENAVYDEGTGQLVTGHIHGTTPCRARPTCRRSARRTTTRARPRDPLGVKGVGEPGTTGSIAAIMNAIANAIPEGRGVDIVMPATPAKVWAACRDV
jgi:carbon-monoxide dehydrogenase large subunit